MAKPIFLIQLPQYTSSEKACAVLHNATKQLNDYHVLVVSTSVKDVEFKAFYDKDLIDTDFESFKEMVLNQITKQGK